MSKIPGVRYRPGTTVNKPAQLFKAKAIVTPRPFYLPKSSNTITQYGQHNRFYKSTHVVQKESGIYQEQTADIYIDGYDEDDGADHNDPVSYKNVDNVLREFSDTENQPTAIATVFSRPLVSGNVVYSPVIKDSFVSSMSFSDEEEETAVENVYVNHAVGNTTKTNDKIELRSSEKEFGNEMEITHNGVKRQTVFLTFGQYIVPPAMDDYKGHAHLPLDRITEVDSQSQNTVSSFSEVCENIESKPHNKVDDFLLHSTSGTDNGIQSKKNSENKMHYDHINHETKERHFPTERESSKNKLEDKTISAVSLRSAIVSNHFQGVELQSIVPKIEVTKDLQSKPSLHTQMSSSVDSGNISLSPGEEADTEDSGDQTQVNSKC